LWLQQATCYQKNKWVNSSHFRHKKCYFTILPTLIFEQFRKAPNFKGALDVSTKTQQKDYECKVALGGTKQESKKYLNCYAITMLGHAKMLMEQGKVAINLFLICSLNLTEPDRRLNALWQTMLCKTSKFRKA
jgi:hypothetical protein